MYRYAIEELKKWKNKMNRKPLILQGARQVGKTWLMKEFGETEFEDVVYISFDRNERMSKLFEGELVAERLLQGIHMYSGKQIKPGKTLLIFDEVQEVPRALTSLKYFYEDAPQYHILCAGSMLGIALHNGTSFPVGKVEFLKLNPLSFKEFLLDVDKETYVAALNNGNFDLITPFKETYIEVLKQYYYVGGMPEVVASFAKNGDFNEVRTIQHNILDAYESDFSKHAPNEVVPKIRMVWNSIPTQLSKENSKFVYGLIKDGARAKEFETSIMWLSDCRLIHKIHRVTSPKLPLKAYADIKAFKLFLLDVGLLSCMTGLKQETLLDGSAVFTEFRGALSEQYVMQELANQKDIMVYYYTNEHNSAEIDFLVDNGKDIIPLEVKAGINLKAKSLKYYKEKYSPRIAIRSSMADYRDECWLINLPLYAISELQNVIMAK